MRSKLIVSSNPKVCSQIGQGKSKIPNVLGESSQWNRKINSAVDFHAASMRDCFVALP
jgi:hypothetical protein